MLMSLFGTVAPALRLPPLWAAGEQGILIDPSAAGTLFQDDAGSTPVTAAGQSVGQVRDRSGRGNHAVQATAAKRPTFQVDASGRPYLIFDGVDDAVATTSITWASSEVSVVMAVRREVRAGAAVMTAFGDTATVSGSWSVLAQSAAMENPPYVLLRRAAAVSDGLLVPALLPETGVLSYTANASGAAVGRYNGQPSAAATLAGVAAFGTYPLVIGQRGTANGYPMAGRIYGLLAINRVLTTQELALAERWAARKCGVTI